MVSNQFGIAGAVVANGYGYESAITRSLSAVTVTTRREPPDQQRPEDDLGYLQI
jgi:hypothetical protein